MVQGGSSMLIPTTCRPLIGLVWRIKIHLWLFSNPILALVFLWNSNVWKDTCHIYFWIVHPKNLLFGSFCSYSSHVFPRRNHHFPIPPQVVVTGRASAQVLEGCPMKALRLGPKIWETWTRAISLGKGPHSWLSWRKYKTRLAVGVIGDNELVRWGYRPA